VTKHTPIQSVTVARPEDTIIVVINDSVDPSAVEAYYQKLKKQTASHVVVLAGPTTPRPDVSAAFHQVIRG
jgi:methylmalonyl-CoA mutase cobalamin-binding subunit